MEEEKIALNNPVLENIYVAESSLLQKPASHNSRLQADHSGRKCRSG